MASDKRDFIFHGRNSIFLTKWKVKPGNRLFQGTVLLLYETISDTDGSGDGKQMKLKSTIEGTVQKLIAREGEVVRPGCVLLQLQTCTHPTVMKDMCADCGADLRELDSDNLAKVVAATSVSMVHSVPELRVSQEEAQQLGQADENHLLSARKLVLLVDLDQTLIHTTNDNILPKIKNVYHFQLYGSHTPWYHTRIRPGVESFLDSMSKLYELHICTFGARPYAHKIANLLDPNGKYFSHRILSRDECFNPNSKTGNLKALFPCGDSMVCIIDDREDVWNFAPNLIPVKPYHFFTNTGDINAPPEMHKNNNENGLSKIEESVYNIKEESSIKSVESSSSSSSSDTNKDDQLLQTAESTLEIKNDDLEEQIMNLIDQSKLPNEEEQKIVSSTQEAETLVATKEISSENSDTQQSESEKDCNNQTDINLADKEDSDDYLLHLEDILKIIHKAYYDMYDQMKAQGKNTIPDLKNVIPYVRRKVLKGVNIVFSGVIPTNMPAERSKLWIVAKSLGANVSPDIEFPGQSGQNGTTHVIAVKWGTIKVNKARKIKDIHIVTPEWLWSCAERWDHVDEKLFLLSKHSVIPRPTATYQPSSFKDNFDCKPDFKDNRRDFISEPNLYPVYDPVTGKKICRDNSNVIQKNGRTDGSEILSEYVTSSTEKFSYSPLLSFSTQEIEDMDKEVDDACSEESEDSDVDTTVTATQSQNDKNKESDSSLESLTGGEFPKGWRKRKKCDLKDNYTELSGIIESEEEENAKFPRRELPCDSGKSNENSSESDDFNESIGSVDEEMAAAVEREFLNS
ncbi:RNA polymerase II subunit A C-terminal domain phosphatase-like [Centruroides sculpturatus]|uniref:RNA polymerase II subunit A C-terminal domain phosphatase-like n=1 Tax=Centruroides sculpturatus TaxID=218467 RepID=UPI000C6CE4B5|nr:RNA polymerase II subunit A C-terminal domain phosphatase-like [Centruroides sculpturatus]